MGKRVATKTQKLSIFSNHTYDALKWIAQVVLPAMATLYLALGSLWGWTNVEQVVGSITALDVFLGVLLGLSANAYKNSDERFDGEMVLDTHDPTKDVYSLEMGIPLDQIESKDAINLKVVK